MERKITCQNDIKEMQEKILQLSPEMEGISILNWKPFETPSEIGVDLALKLSRAVHNNCKDVPHDIGLVLLDIIKAHSL